ncbi:MAG: DUF4199 domain-containing protein [Chitinophagaceae bacterium]
MKRIVLINGALASVMASLWLALSIFVATDKILDLGMFIGFSTMTLAFVFVFIAIAQYRNNVNGGYISFGKAFQIGFLVTLMASTVYVLVWLIDFQFFNQDFMAKYNEAVLNKMRLKGVSAVELAKKAKVMAEEAYIYNNSIWVRIGYTYLEILPLGTLITAIAALVLKRKNKASESATIAED